MRKLAGILAAAALLLGVACGQKDNGAQPTPSTSGSPSPSPSSSTSPTPTPSQSKSPSPRATPSSATPLFSGRVTTTAGSGIASICVTTTPPSDDDRIRWKSGTTDAAGRFSVKAAYNDGAQDRSPWLLEFWDCNTTTSYAPQFVEVMVPANRITSGMKVVLKRGATITGIARDQNSDPAAGACVAVYDGTHQKKAGTEPQPEYTVRAGADGSFKLSGLSAKTQRLFFGHCSGSVFQAEWYKDKPPAYSEFRYADQISVTLGKTVSIGTVDLERV